MEAVEMRPSLLAAVDTSGKIMGAFGLFALPFVIPALIAGEPVLATGIFAGGQLLGLYPALIAALGPAVNLAFTRYHLTEDGIQITTQFIQRSERRVPWEKITAVRHRRTMLDVLVRKERLDVIAYGERGATLHLVGLADGAPLRNIIAGKMRENATVEALLRGD